MTLTIVTQLTLAFLLRLEVLVCKTWLLQPDLLLLTPNGFLCPPETGFLSFKRPFSFEPYLQLIYHIGRRNGQALNHDEWLNLTWLFPVPSSPASHFTGSSLKAY